LPSTYSESGKGLLFPIVVLGWNVRAAGDLIYRGRIRYIAGRRPPTWLVPFNNDATWRLVDSACQLPVICTFIGNLSLLVPNRIARPSRRAMLSGAVEP
jgi:hypothetical protein